MYINSGNYLHAVSRKGAMQGEFLRRLSTYTFCIPLELAFLVVFSSCYSVPTCTLIYIYAHINGYIPHMRESMWFLSFLHCVAFCVIIQPKSYVDTLSCKTLTTFFFRDQQYFISIYTHTKFSFSILMEMRLIPILWYSELNKAAISIFIIAYSVLEYFFVNSYNPSSFMGTYAQMSSTLNMCIYTGSQMGAPHWFFFSFFNCSSQAIG